MLLLGQPAHAQGPASGAAIYSCVDAYGRKHTADRPIPACADREQKILNPSGTVKAVVGPTLSPQERAAQEELRKKAAEERAAKDEEKLRRRLLLQRYPSQPSHDAARSEALNLVLLARDAALQRVAVLKAQQNELADEMEFFKKDPGKAPAALRHKIQESGRNQEVQGKLITSQDAEMKRINRRFDHELALLKKLWAGPASPVGVE